MRWRRRLTLVSLCGSHAQPADAVTLHTRAPVERHGKGGGGGGGVAALAVSVPVRGGVGGRVGWWGADSCALSADVNWMYVTKQREHLMLANQKMRVN